MRCVRRLWLPLLLLCTAVRVHAEPGSGGGHYAEVLTLKSGLRLALHSERGSGTVAVCSTYPAGLGRDGGHGGELARAVAETLREGGRRAQAAEYSRVLRGRGASSDVFLGRDRVEFCTQAPSHELLLALWLESGRSRPYAFTPENFGERIAELRFSEPEDPRALAETKSWSLAFPRLSRISEGATNFLDEARLFHAEQYRLDRAVLTIAGDFEPSEARARAEELFAEPPSTPVARIESPPRQTSPRYMAVEHLGLSAPIHRRAWIIPGGEAPEHAALEVAGELLAGGGDSLLGEAFVATGLARRVSYAIETHRGTDLFSLTVELSAIRNDLDLVAALDQIIRVLASTPARADQVERARSRLRVRRAFALESSLGQARWLGERVSLGLVPDPDASARALLAVTPDDVRRAATVHLAEARRIVVELLPKEAREPFQQAPPRFHVVTEGEALARIARREGTTVEELLRLNELDKKRTLKPGQKLKLPPAKPRRVHLVKKGDTLLGIAKRYGVSVPIIRRENRLGPKSVIRTGQELTIPRAP